ncbi:MAG TPA: DUF4157 domain-containing protein [Gemmatimonas sp.]|nr:DUF4157 domain-containing protein [Gemmatimonas sp.]
MLNPVRRIVELLAGRHLELPHELLQRHPDLAGVRWRRGGLPPRVGGWALGQRSVLGITLGKTVFLAPHAALSPALLLHELAHVHQFERDVAFPVRYLWESLRRGYRRNRFEFEADSYASSRLSRPPSGAR